MINELDIEMIVPQHGHRYFKGKDVVNRFVDWVSNLQCGIDLLDKKRLCNTKRLIPKFFPLT